MSGVVIWTLVALGLAVLVVRRRSLAVALVTAQALVLAGFALDEAESSGDVLAASRSRFALLSSPGSSCCSSRAPERCDRCGRAWHRWGALGSRSPLRWL